MSQQLDPYRVLQVHPDADQEEIKVAFRRLARRYHPDRAADAESTARMIEVNRAWELIGDPTSRAAFDRANGRLSPATRAASRRAAETRQRPVGDPMESAPPGTGARSFGSPYGRSRGEAPASSGRGANRPASGASAAPGPDPADPPDDPPEVPHGEAGPPPGRASGSVITFGRYAGWSIGEIARVDRDYLEWFISRPGGWQYRNEIRDLLARTAPPSAQPAAPKKKRGFFGR